MKEKLNEIKEKAKMLKNNWNLKNELLLNELVEELDIIIREELKDEPSKKEELLLRLYFRAPSGVLKKKLKEILVLK